MKFLEIVEDEKDFSMLEAISNILNKFNEGMTAFQIYNFVLNEIEFPTAFSKMQQVKLELHKRFHEIVSLYYEMKTLETKILINEEKAAKAFGPFKKLVELDTEQKLLRIQACKNRLRSILAETRIFYEIYKKHEEIDKLSPEEQVELEIQAWASKTVNMPAVFEERYGAGYMQRVLGNKYTDYLEIRQKVFGLLPREVFNQKMSIEP